jgi:hypothetical protein
VAEVSPPGGGLVAETYFIPRTVLDCDLFIDVPVMKITGAVGMTVAMKNLIGIAPGMVYGWSKSAGFPPGGDSPGLWHSAASLDETLSTWPVLPMWISSSSTRSSAWRRPASWA